MRRVLVFVALLVMAFGMIPVAPGTAAGQDTTARPARGETKRLSGPTRVETAVEVSRSTFEPDVPIAFVATAAKFPDALTGGPLAARLGAPILLALTDRLPDATAAELRRLRPGRIVVLGGTAAISAAVVDELAPLARAGVDRIAGPTRFETAAQIALQGFTQPVGVVFVVTGHDFPDALSGAAAAARLGGPVLLADTGVLPDATRTALEQLKPRRIVVLGGRAVVGDGVMNELAHYTAADVERWAGADRYETSARIAAEAFTASDTSAVFVATGAAYPDAVTGAAAAGALRGPLLLTSRFQLPERVAAELARLAPGGLDVFVLGGEAAVSRQVAEQLAAYANPTLSQLTVTATDAVTGGPVAGARLVLRRGDDATAAVTGADGRYTFERLTWGRVLVDADRLGYAPSSAEVDVAPGQVATRALALVRVASLTGRVTVFGNGTQVPGASVTAQRVVDGNRVGPVYGAVADDDGRYLISDPAGGLVPGSYRVRAARDGYEDTAQFFTVEEGAWTEEAHLPLVRSG